MIETIWTYRVKAERREEFERRYAPDGDWARLFRQAKGYQETRLMHDVRDPDRYATVDRWESVQAMDEIKQQFAREYAELDAVCGELTVEEQHVGVFQGIG